jgi:hypothetical protein
VTLEQRCLSSSVGLPPEPPDCHQAARRLVVQQGCAPMSVPTVGVSTATRTGPLSANLDRACGDERLTLCCSRLRADNRLSSSLSQSIGQIRHHWHSSRTTHNGRFDAIATENSHYQSKTAFGAWVRRESMSADWG